MFTDNTELIQNENEIYQYCDIIKCDDAICNYDVWCKYAGPRLLHTAYMGAVNLTTDKAKTITDGFTSTIRFYMISYNIVSDMICYKISFAGINITRMSKIMGGNKMITTRYCFLYDRGFGELNLIV